MEVILVYWLELDVEAPCGAGEAVVSAMALYGLETVEETVQTDGACCWRGHLLWSLDADRVVPRLRRRIKALPRCADMPAGPYRVRSRRIFYQPVGNGWCFDAPMPVLFPNRLGERIVVKDAGHDYAPAPGEVVVALAPSCAFGNGAHPSTRLACRALERVVRAGDRVVDVGTGTGLLALSAARLGASWVMAVDSEMAAVAAVNTNASLNDLDAIVTAGHNDGLSGLTFDPVDVAVANILPQVIEEITPDVVRLLKPGGLFVMGGITDDHVDLLDQTLKMHGLEFVSSEAEDRWCCLTYRRA